MHVILYADLLYRSYNNTDVIFHKRVRVFYQGLQTRENNRIHELLTKRRLLLLRACKARKTMDITRLFRPRDFYCL